jgi:putative acetyltransferase
MKNMEVRAEKPEDIEAIHKINTAAFGRSQEARLVDRLRHSVTPFLSFVAVEFNQIIGHLLFTPVTIVGNCTEHLSILGLAPVAVRPDCQRQGIGTFLIQQGLAACDRLKFQAIFVLGDPAYYSRFGFVPAKARGLNCEYSVPDEAFMVLELEKNALINCTGTVQYRSEFNEPESSD